MKFDIEFTCIDGNIAKYNVQAYCNYKKGFLTAGLAKTHRCLKRGCKNYIPLKQLFTRMLKKEDINHVVYVKGISNK